MQEIAFSTEPSGVMFITEPQRWTLLMLLILECVSVRWDPTLDLQLLTQIPIWHQTYVSLGQRWISDIMSGSAEIRGKVFDVGPTKSRGHAETWRLWGTPTVMLGLNNNEILLWRDSCIYAQWVRAHQKTHLLFHFTAYIILLMHYDNSMRTILYQIPKRQSHGLLRVNI